MFGRIANKACATVVHAVPAHRFEIKSEGPPTKVCPGPPVFFGAVQVAHTAFSLYIYVIKSLFVG